MSASAHYEAFFARLNADSMLAGKGADSVKLTTGNEAVRANYWILYASTPGDLDDERYTAEQRADSKAVYRYDFRAVGTTREAVLTFVDRANGQAIGYRLSVSGRECDAVHLLPEVEGGRVQYDRETRLFYLDQTYEFTSRPA